MRYQGSVAYDMGAEPRRRERVSQEPRRSFEGVPAAA